MVKLYVQKKTVRIMTGVKPRNSCRSLFKKLEILPLPCEGMFALMNFFVDKQVHFSDKFSCTPC
jgi:hypothetical protein